MPVRNKDMKLTQTSKRVSSNYARTEQGYETRAVTMRVRNKDVKLTQTSKCVSSNYARTEQGCEWTWLAECNIAAHDSHSYVCMQTLM